MSHHQPQINPRRGRRFGGRRKSAGFSNATTLIAILLFGGATLAMLYSEFTRQAPTQDSAPIAQDPPSSRIQPNSAESDPLPAVRPPASPKQAAEPAAPAESSPDIEAPAESWDEALLPQPREIEPNPWLEPEPEAYASKQPEPASGDNRESPPKRTADRPADTPEAEEEAVAEEEEPEASDDLPEGDLSIAGRVLNRYGEPVAGIEVTATLRNLFSAPVRPAVAARGKSRRALTGYDGVYRFDLLADGEYQLGTAQTEIYKRASVVVRAGVATADLMLEERERELLIYGTVQDAGYEPLEGVQVTPIGHSARKAKSDETGAYRLQFPLTAKRRENTLLFSLRGFREKRIPLSENEVRGAAELLVDAQLEPVEALAEVTGIVTAGNSGELIAEEAVQFYSHALQRRYYKVTDKEGTFSFPEVETGADYQLSIRPKALFRDYIRSDIQVAGGGLYLEVALEPANRGVLSGQMIDVNNAPISGFSLWLKNRETANWEAIEVTGDGAGYYRAGDVPAGDVVFETYSRPYFSITNINLSTGEELNVPLVLDWGGYRIHGRVVDEGDSPVAGADVTLSWFHRKKGDRDGVRSHSRRETSADTGGLFSFSRLGPGLHTIGVEAPGFKKATLRHVIENGENKEIVVRLTRTAG